MLRCNDRLAIAPGRTLGASHKSGVQTQLERSTLVQLESRPMPVVVALSDGPPPREEPESVPESSQPLATLRSYTQPGAEGLTEADIDVVFQPIVAVTSRRVFAY